MTVYLLHFDAPIGNEDNPRGLAQHYIGNSDQLCQRLKAHRSGNGCRIVEVAIKDYHRRVWLTRLWPGGYDEERKLKAQHNAPRLCPVCRAKAGAQR